jgi:hypothetical protein
MIRWASTHASRLASALSGATELEEETISETVWCAGARRRTR